MSNHRTIGHDGEPCPRCGQPTEIREHVEIGEKQLRRACYYRRWTYCTNPNCKTTTIHSDAHRVWNDAEQQRLDAIKQQLTPRE